MSDDIIDTIAQDIWQRHAVETGRSLEPGLADKLAESALAALRERCAITTVEQLDALPVYSVLRCAYTSQAGRKLHELWERLEGGWFCIGAPLKPPYQDFGMPLFPSLLIWHPGWAASEADQ